MQTSIQCIANLLKNKIGISAETKTIHDVTGSEFTTMEISRPFAIKAYRAVEEVCLKSKIGDGYIMGWLTFNDQIFTIELTNLNTYSLLTIMIGDIQPRSIVPLSDCQAAIFDDVDFPVGTGRTAKLTVKFESQMTGKTMTLSQGNVSAMIYRANNWESVRDAFNDDWAIDFDELVAGLWGQL